MGNPSVRECLTKVYQAARDGSSDIENLLKRLKTTKQRKTALETKTKDGSHFVTPLIIAAHDGHLNSVKIPLGYRADIEVRGTLKIAEEIIKGCTVLYGPLLPLVILMLLNCLLMKVPLRICKTKMATLHFITL